LTALSGQPIARSIKNLGLVICPRKTLDTTSVSFGGSTNKVSGRFGVQPPFLRHHLSHGLALSGLIVKQLSQRCSPPDITEKSNEHLNPVSAPLNENFLARFDVSSRFNPVTIDVYSAKLDRYSGQGARFKKPRCPEPLV